MFLLRNAVPVIVLLTNVKRNYMKKITLLFILFNSLIAIAQNPASDSIIVVKEVVVSANRFETPKANVAQQIEVYGKEKIESFNAPTSGDVLMQTGLVNVQKSQQGGSSPILRGFEASRVLLVVDGVRMNNIIYRAGHLQNVITIDNSMLDRIEVLFGPASSMFGSDALGGVMHFISRRPQLATGEKKVEVHGNALVRYNYGNTEFTPHLDFNVATKKFASLTSATFSHFGDLRQGKKRNFLNDMPGTDFIWDRNFYVKRFGTSDSIIANNDPSIQRGSGYKQYDLMQKFLFKQDDHITHLLNVQFSNTTNVPRYDRLTDLSGGKLKAAEWYYGPQTRLLAAYEFSYLNPGGAIDEVKAGVNYQFIVESRHNRDVNKRFRTDRTEKVNVPAFFGHIRKQLGANTIIGGIEGQFNTLKSSAVQTDVIEDTTKAATTRYPDGKNSMNSVALFVSHSYNWKDRIIISEGLRYNYVGLSSQVDSNLTYRLNFGTLKQNHHAISGNIGVVFNTNVGFRAAISGSTGFRAPNVDDLVKIFESAPGAVIVPNPKLKPEYTFNGEVTLSQTFAKRVTVSATGFYTYIKNVIQTDKDSYLGQDSIVYDGVLSKVMTAQNKGKAFIAGAGAQLDARITNWFRVYGSFNFTYGRTIGDTTILNEDSTTHVETDYDPLDHIPPFFGKVGTEFSYKNFSSNFFVLYNGKKKIEDYSNSGEDNGAYATPYGMPAWMTFNIRAAYKVTKNFGVEAGVDNLLDTNYRVFASGISGMGRTFFVTLRANF